MHELSICESLLDTVERVADQHAAASVERIVVTIGPLSGVEADLLQHAYPLVAAGTIAAEAELVIETAGIVVRCEQCAAESTAAPNDLSCDNCGGFRTRVVHGDELLLQTVELRSAASLNPTH